MAFPATLDLVWEGVGEEPPDGQADAIYRDDRYDLVVTHVDGALAPIDVSTRTVVAQVRTALKPGAGEVLATFDVDDSLAAVGVVTLSIPAATIQPGLWFWDYQETNGSSAVHTIIRGRARVVGDVST